MLALSDENISEWRGGAPPLLKKCKKKASSKPLVPEKHTRYHRFCSKRVPGIGSMYPLQLEQHFSTTRTSMFVLYLPTYLMQARPWDCSAGCAFFLFFSKVRFEGMCKCVETREVLTWGARYYTCIMYMHPCRSMAENITKTTRKQYSQSLLWTVKTRIFCGKEKSSTYYMCGYLSDFGGKCRHPVGRE